MVVCPCGVMVPAPGLGRLRRASRGHGCFDHQNTVTTQPKEEAQEPASIDKLAAATADPSSIPRPLSRTSKNNNKGPSGKAADDNVKGDHNSRTTLALATRESGRYVGTRPLRSNRSPTPTLHRIPSKDQKNTTGNGRPSKHLPAVRTSPTSPQDNNNQDVSVTTRPASRIKGPTALPRHNHVNQRMNELNISNQRRLLKQTLSSGERLPNVPTRIPFIKSETAFGPNSMAPKTRIYENLPRVPRAEKEETVYENLRPPRKDSGAAAELPGGDDVTESDESSSADTVTSEPPGDSEESTVWLSDSWKYNTIKKAPDFNIFEFSDFDSKEDGEKRKEKRFGLEKEKKTFRSRLPLFGRRSERDNKTCEENAIKPSLPSAKAVKPDNKRTHKHLDGLKSPANVHTSKTPKPLERTPSSSSFSVAVGGARNRDVSPFSSDSESGACMSPVRPESQRAKVNGFPEPPSRPGSRRTSVASSSSSSLSPLASPSPSLRSLQETRYGYGRYPPTSPSPSLRSLQEPVYQNGPFASPQNPSLRPLQKHRQERSSSSSSTLSLRSLQEGRPSRSLSASPSPSLCSLPECHQGNTRQRPSPALTPTHRPPYPGERPNGAVDAGPPGLASHRQPIPEHDEITENNDVNSKHDPLPRPPCDSRDHRSSSRRPVSSHDSRRRSLQAGALTPSALYQTTWSPRHRPDQHDILKDTRPPTGSYDVIDGQRPPLRDLGGCLPPSLSPSSRYLTSDGRSAKGVPHMYQSLPQLHTSASSHSSRPSCRPHAPPSTPSHARALPPQPVYANIHRGKGCEFSPAGRSLALLPRGDFYPRRPSAYPSEEASAPLLSGRNSAASPVLPPLPPGVLPEANSPLESRDVSCSPEDKLNLASICILSLDLTVDCEELGDNGFSLVTVTENGRHDENDDDRKPGKDSSPSQDEGSDTTPPEADTGIGSSSSHSSSSNMDEKYYGKDDYDSVDDGVCVVDELADEELISDQNGDEKNDLSRKINKLINGGSEEDDFIEADCDVKPMETLKRPLAYGYGSSPIRSLRGPSFLEKRLSQASDVSEHMEMDLAESLLASEGPTQSDSCMNLKETYWDHYQATKERKGDRNFSGIAQGKVDNPCPSTRFCYDPEILLAQVRCPKSLEDATFRQYSAFVKSHIYDHFGNVHEELKQYGLSERRLGWISSQPDLPDAPRHQAPPEMSSLDYNSEPELTYCHDRRQGMPTECNTIRCPAPRPPPPPINTRGPADSGSWTYFQPFDQHQPVAMPRSSSSLSHVAPDAYNPWLHLLPDVTPPRTPRHSAYYSSAVHSTRSSPTKSRPTSPSKTSDTRPQTEEQRTTPKPSPSRRRSFLSNFTKVKVRSPLRKPGQEVKPPEVKATPGKDARLLPAPHKSIQTRTFTGASSKSSSSSSSSSSASSKDSVTTVIPAPRNKGARWFMRHFVGAKEKVSAV